MRSFAKAAFAAVLGALTLPAPGLAQVEEAVTTPRRPIPYTSLRPKAAPQPAPAGPAVPSPATVATGPAGLPTTPGGARLAQGAPLSPAELEAFVDGAVKTAMDQEHIAGVTVAVVQNGQVMLKKGYGFATLAPARRVDPDRTLFRIGSVSKTFTWIALMKEVEAGRIRIDGPVNLYLPERLQIRDEGYREPVRVANLMDHSAGFEDRALGQLFERRPDRERPLAEYLRQERPRRVHPPGEVSSYSNYGAALAGQAVSYVAGKPFERLIEDEIFTPLGLAHTTFREPRPRIPGLAGPMPAPLARDVADGFRWARSDFQERPYEYIGHIAPAGSASSTAADMARYMQLLLNGGTLDGVTIYGPRSAQAFRTPLRATPPGINGWPHGFIQYDLPGGYRGYGHAGATLSFASNLVVVPDLGLGIFISANTDTAGPLAARLPALVVQQFYAQPQPLRPGSRALTEARDRYEGYYVATRRAYHGLEGFVGLLRGGAWVKVSSDGKLVVATPEETRTWTPEDGATSGRFIAAASSERLAFDLGQGPAGRFLPWFGGMAYERAAFWREPGVLGMLAGLAMLAAAATLAGLALRNRREFRETSIQSRASLIQSTQAALWLASGLLFVVWATKTGDVARVMYDWPGAALIIASACAMVAAALTVAIVIALPAVWRGGRRLDSWSPLRKLAFTVTTLIYAAFSVVLGLWGGLSPWAG